MVMADNPGRPTKYRERYCDEIIEFMKDGSTMVQFAAKIGVSKTTINQWRKDYAEFSVAVDIAKTGAQAYQEKLLQKLTEGQGSYTDPVTGKTHTYSEKSLHFALARRFKDWQDKPDIQQVISSDLIPFTSLKAEVDE